MYRAEKKYPLKTFGNISPNDWKFLNKIVHSFYMFTSTQPQNLIQLSATITKLCNIKQDHFMNFYISLEKREKLQYLCNSTTDLHKN